MRKIVLVVAALVAAVAAATAGAKTVVGVTLKEFKVIPAVKTAKAGPVVFNARNTGTVDHELVVIKTNLAPAKLPIVGGKASEKGRVGRIAVKRGKRASLVLTLKRGKYVLICNLPGHYVAGQRAGFTVT